MSASMGRKAHGSAAPWAPPMVGFLVTASVLTVLQARDPTSGRAVTSYAAISIGASIAILYGVRRHRPLVTTPWYLTAAAAVLGCLGMVSRLRLTGPQGTVTSLVPDLVTIPAYGLLIAGLIGLLRARRGAEAGTALDAGLMGVAALFMSWAMLIQPLLADADMPTFAQGGQRNVPHDLGRDPLRRGPHRHDRRVVAPRILDDGLGVGRADDRGPDLCPRLCWLTISAPPRSELGLWHLRAPRRRWYAPVHGLALSTGRAARAGLRSRPLRRRGGRAARPGGRRRGAPALDRRGTRRERGIDVRAGCPRSPAHRGCGEPARH